jgi:hypothetical protein
MIPTADTFFLNNYFSDSLSDDDKKLWLECNRQAKESVQIMIEFAKLHVEVALKAASEKASLTDFAYEFLQEGAYDAIDKDTILNSYSLDNIK